MLELGFFRTLSDAFFSVFDLEMGLSLIEANSSAYSPILFFKSFYSANKLLTSSESWATSGSFSPTAIWGGSYSSLAYDYAFTPIRPVMDSSG